jgi:GT2 family glycosyltransferase
LFRLLDDMVEPRVSVIILNWNRKDYLKKCLPTVLTQDYGNFSVILVDNASTDGSVDFVRQTFPAVEIISLDRNYEFAKANNIGIAKAFSDQAMFVALLNNDTIAEKSWLSRLVGGIEEDKKIGIVASKLLRMDTPEILDATGHVFLDGIIHDRGFGELDRGQYDTKLEVIGGCAAAVLYRKEMLEQIGFFDEQFGYGYEDAELSWRAYRRGWKARYIPGAIVYHIRGGTVNSDRRLMEQMSRRCMLNLIRAIKRHATAQQKLWVSLIWIKEAARQRIDSLIKGKKIDSDYFEWLSSLWFKKS